MTAMIFGLIASLLGFLYIVKSARTTELNQSLAEANSKIEVLDLALQEQSNRLTTPSETESKLRAKLLNTEEEVVALRKQVASLELSLRRAQAMRDSLLKKHGALSLASRPEIKDNVFSSDEGNQESASNLTNNIKSIETKPPKPQKEKTPQLASSQYHHKLIYPAAKTADQPKGLSCIEITKNTTTKEAKISFRQLESIVSNARYELTSHELDTLKRKIIKYQNGEAPHHREFHPKELADEKNPYRKIAKVLDYAYCNFSEEELSIIMKSLLGQRFYFFDHQRQPPSPSPIVSQENGVDWWSRPRN